MDLLRAQQRLSYNYAERTTISIQMLDLEKQGRDAEIVDRVRKAERDAAEGKITATALERVRVHAATLRAESDKQDALDRQVVLAEQEAERYEDAVRLDALTLELNEKKLQGEAALAETAQEQRAIQLRLLDLSYQQERARYEAVLADRQATDAAQEDARRRLSALSETYGDDRQAVMRGTRGPLEEWAASIPKTAAEINEAFQSIEAQGLDGLSDAIADVITGTKSLADAFGDVAKSIIADLIKMSVRMLIFRGLSSVLGGAFGGSGAISESGATSLGVDLPGFATGGSFRVLGRHGRDRNTLSLNGIPMANVSHRERISVGNDNSVGPSKVIVELRDAMLDARIADGANIQIVRTYPVLQAGVQNSMRERSRRA